MIDFAWGTYVLGGLTVAAGFVLARLLEAWL